MDYFENVNHAISVGGYWIFDSNCKRELLRNIESFNIICSPSVGEEQVAVFETLFTAVRYIVFYERLKKD